MYFKEDDKSTSDSLRLSSATVLDDTTDSGISGKPLKQLTHLLKKSFANSWVSTEKISSQISIILWFFGPS